MCDGKASGSDANSKGGYRRVDHVIGIAADILLDGKVIKTVASSPFVMKKHKEGSIK